MRRISTKIMVITIFITIMSVFVMGGISYLNLTKQSRLNYQDFEKYLYDDYDTLIRYEVESAISALDQIYKKYETGEITLEESKKLSADVIRSMRYGEDGYFWIDTVEGLNIVNLGQASEGTNRLDLKDSNGTYLIKELIENAKNGGGYLNYWFPKPGEKEPSLKRSYSMMFEPFQWVVGTGNYIDNLDAITASFRESNENRIQHTIMILIYSVIGILAVAIFAGYISGKKLSKPILALKSVSEKAAQGDMDVEFHVNTQDEIKELSNAFSILIESMKEQADNALKISEGNLSVEIHPKSEKDVLGKSLRRMLETIKKTHAEVSRSIMNIETGRFRERSMDDSFAGGWKDIVSGVDRMLQGFVVYLDSLPVIILTIDKDFNIKYMNRTGQLLFNFDEKEEINKKCYGCFNTEDCNTENCACARAMEEGKITFSETTAQIGSETRYLRYTGIPITDENEEVTGVFEVVLDQTEIKRSQIISQKQADYQEKEVEKLILSLEKLSQGNLEIRSSVAEADSDTDEIAGNFRKINKSLVSTTNIIKSYIKELSEVLGYLADKNFDTEINREYVGDFKELKLSINHIIEQLNSVLLTINSAAEQVETGAEQVAASSQSLSQGASEQASSVEEIGATVAEIAGQTRDNAENANKANEISIQAKLDAQEGNEKMQQMLNAMDAIKISSENISNIIKVVDEIAFQTNILALNAAVEAARAGEHGKGFAVVAEEVRNLAARSAKAAKETADLIDSSIEKVKEGYHIASDTAEALEKIVSGAKDTVEIVQMIAEASNKQSAAITEINKGIDQISQVTQANTATAEESASGSEEMAGQAQMLKGMIGEFKLKNSGEADHI